MYIVATVHLDWDLTFLSEHLIDQIAAWHKEWRATHPPADERLASRPIAGPTPSSAEPLAIPPPPPKVHLEQVIEHHLAPVVKADESDESVGQIDNLDGVLDHQEE